MVTEKVTVWPGFASVGENDASTFFTALSNAFCPAAGAAPGRKPIIRAKDAMTGTIRFMRRLRALWRFRYFSSDPEGVTGNSQGFQPLAGSDPVGVTGNSQGFQPLASYFGTGGGVRPLRSSVFTALV